MRIEVFVPPSEEEIRNMTRHEERFLEEVCTRDPEAKIRPSELYAAYADWCEYEYIHPKSITQVAPIWRQLGLKRVVIRGYPYYRGVRLIIPAGWMRECSPSPL